MLLLDTNVYLDVDRDAALGRRVAGFLAAHGDSIGVCSVVVAELLIGVVSRSEERRLLRATLGAIPAEHVLTPAHDDWRTAASALNSLGGDMATKGPSFWNDLLIAATCASAGATLLTRNVADFRRIQGVIPVGVRQRPD